MDGLSPIALVALAHMIRLRGCPGAISAPLALALDAAAPPCTAAESARTLAHLMTEPASDTASPVGGASPAERFLRRAERRRAERLVPVELESVSHAWRLADRMPPSAIDTIRSAEAHLAVTKAASNALVLRQRQLLARQLRASKRWLERQRRTETKTLHAEALSLALALAERLAGGPLAAEPLRLLNLVEASGEDRPLLAPVRLRVASRHAHLLREALNREGLGPPEFTVVGDPGLGATDLLLDDAQGRRDLRLESRLLALLPTGTPR